MNQSTAIVYPTEKNEAQAIERAIKRFFARLENEQAAFVESIEGAADTEARRLRAFVIINRLIFVYFIQKRGLLHGDTDYLRSKLNESKRRGTNLFYSTFLQKLFFEGFSRNPRERSSVARRLLGEVPYLCADFFARHKDDDRIEISDAAFEKLLDFLDGYRWSLNKATHLSNHEINAEVIGFVFERQVNQKQMGAYYTKDDITEYIGRSTIIPFLFDRAGEACRDAFEKNSTAWKMLRDSGDRYIFSSLKKGGELPLPAQIKDMSDALSGRAPDRYALATETWRETIARRKRYEAIRAMLAAGEIRSIDDFITFNLDLRRFAEDFLLACEVKYLRAFWQAIENISVLDPTCGSGAFLLGALRILAPLYEACLERMKSLLEEADRCADESDAETLAFFRHTLERVAAHGNRRSFVVNSIIANNLFGVDIMEEAVEICRIRLCLKLLEQTERPKQVEEMTAIKFNLRAGNALTGCTAIKDTNRNREQKPLSSDKPFNWPDEFHSVTSGGGFCVIIGNPPYLSAAGVRNEYSVAGYRTARCPDVYAWVLERSASLLKAEGRSGMIVPLSLTFGGNFKECREMIFDEYGANWFSSFARIPSALFSFDVRIRNAIHIGHKSNASEKPHTTRIHRWFEAARPHLFEAVEYAPFSPAHWQGRIPKLNTEVLSCAFERLLQSTRSTLGMSFSERPTPHALHFKKTAYNWLNFCRRLPPCYDRDGKSVAHTKFGTIHFADAQARDIAFLLLNGKIMFAFWCIVGDDFDVTQWMFSDFPVDLCSIPEATSSQLIKLAGELEESMNENISFKLNAGKRVGNYNLAKCREATDKSDRVFASLLGLERAWPEIELLYSQTVKTDFGGNAR